MNRYLIMLALLTPLVAETVETTSEARLSAERITVLYKDIEKLRAASKLCSLPSRVSEKPSVDDIIIGDSCTQKIVATSEGTAL